MKKPLHKQFTYGFEIEGAFTNELCRELRAYAREHKYNFKFKYDGSVSVSPSWGYSIRSPYSEINLGVFKRFEDMIEVLQMFTASNYVSNTTCGLHVHVKPKYYWNDEKIMDMFWSYEFVKKMQKYADTNLCDCQHERLHSRPGERYCAFHKNFAYLRNNFMRQSKFVFVGNHPSGTYEFRFFSACSHKVQNVKKFFAFAFDELAEISPDKSVKVNLDKGGTSKTINIDFATQLSVERPRLFTISL